MDFLTPEISQIVVRGILITLLLTAVTSLSSLALGMWIGMVRISGSAIISRAAAVYVDVFRNIPALVLIIFLAFAVPNAFPAAMRQSLFFNNVLVRWAEGVSGLSLPYYALAAAAALTLNTSAYLAELFRAGVGTLPNQYVDAASTLGASKRLVWWQILIPQGFAAAYPAITTRLIHNMKNTALVSFVAVPDFFHSMQAAINRTFLALEFLILAAVFYLLLSISMNWLLVRLGEGLKSGPPQVLLA